MPAGCLSNDLQVLNEIKQEALYYQLPKLVDAQERKIKVLQGHLKAINVCIRYISI